MSQLASPAAVNNISVISLFASVLVVVFGLFLVIKNKY